MKLGLPDFVFRVLPGITKIEFDPDKEEINRQKHGYSLQSAVWLLGRLCLPIKNKHYVSKPFFENEEIRHQHLLEDNAGNICVMVTTMRSEEVVRVISFRRASESEIANFKQCMKNSTHKISS